MILAKQTDIVADLCNLGTDFKKLVFSLWAAYLEKNEIAFEDDADFESMPKLQHFTLNRDYNYIVKGENELKRTKKIQVREHLESTYRFGNKKIRINKKPTAAATANEEQANDQQSTDQQIENEDNQTAPENDRLDLTVSALEYCISDVEMDGNETQLSDDESDGLYDEEPEAEPKRKKYKKRANAIVDPVAKKVFNKYARNKFKRLSNKEKTDLYLSIYSKKDDDESNEDEEDEETARLFQQILDERVKLNLMTNEKEKKIQNEKVMKLKEQYHFSKYAKSIIKIGMFERQSNQRNINRVKPRDVSRMTSTKTICFMYIAIRILNYDIYLFDLIRWIKFNNLPYFSVCHLLPSDWLFIENDYLSFVRNVAPQLTQLNTTVTPIVNYLEITKFPLPNIKRLIVRMSTDLNLPYSLAKFVCNVFDEQMEKNPNANKVFDKNVKTNWFTVPEYETIAFSLVFLSLKHLFCINDYRETRLSEKLSKAPVDQLFIWSEWEEHIKFKLECFNTFIYPFKESKKSLEIKNYEMYADYYAYNIENPKHDLFEPSMKKTKKLAIESTKEVPQLFERLTTNDERKETKIEPSFYPFNAYTEYINRNFKTRNDDLLNKDFKNLRIDYLFENNCKNIRTDNPKLKRSRKRFDYESEHNEKIKFLISLAVVYLGSHFLSFLKVASSVERKFFSDYFDVIRFDSKPEEPPKKLKKSGRRRTKKQRNESALTNLGSFIDNFVIENSTVQESIKQPKVLEI